ncbi:MAG: diguanylate cyclase domain-containing protein [Cellulosilyticaceae bacterium]
MENKLFLDIVENQEYTIIIVNQEKRVIYANKMGKMLIGTQMGQLLGNYLECPNAVSEGVACQQTSYCDTCEINKSLDEVWAGGGVRCLKGLKIIKANKGMTVNLKVSAISQEYMMLEFTELKLDLTYLNLLHHLMDESKDMIFFKNHTLAYEYINQEYAKFYNRPKAYLIGKTDRDLMEEKLLPNELYLPCLEGDRIALEKGHYYGMERMGTHYFRVFKERIDGGILCIARDVTEEIKFVKKSESDELTKLYNRRKLKSAVKHLYEQEIPHYVALIDLDNLREINNEKGHATGDMYLQELGAVLGQVKEGTFFRIGGDEFVGLISIDTDLKLVLEGIFLHLSQLQLEPSLTISVGAKQVDFDKDYLENYDETDQILYTAKKKGKNQFVIR